MIHSVGKFFAIVIFSSILLHIIKLIDVFDVFKKVGNSGTRDCYHVPGIKHGAEDINLFPEMDVAIVSSGFNQDYPSNIFLVDLSDVENAKSKAFAFDDSFTEKRKSFHPHGIDTRLSSTGDYHLYVINHDNEEECVDVFSIDFNQVKLTHIQRITSPLFRNLNDLVVVEDFKFYATNWLPGRNKLYNLVTGLLMLPAGDVVFYDNGGGFVAIDHLFIPNGIHISENHAIIYVGLCGSKAVESYTRSSENTLHFIKKFNAISVVDNLHYIKAEGSNPAQLWFAGPFRMLEAVIKENKVMDTKVPSFVSRFSIDEDGNLVDLQELMVDDGNMISGASSATPYKEFILVGSVEHKMLVCRGSKKYSKSQFKAPMDLNEEL